MALYRKDGVLCDPLKTISRNVDKAVNLNREVARSNTQHVAQLEKERKRSLREITQMQKSLITNSSLNVASNTNSNHHNATQKSRPNGNKRLTRFASFDEGHHRHNNKAKQ